MTDGKWTDTVIDALQSAESAQRRAKELEAERDSLRVYIERLETALSEIAATTPAPLSEADVAPAMFAKLNAAIKTARQAL